MRNLPLNLIRQALNEDGAWSDITTLSTVPGEQQARASIIARRAGVIAGLNVAAEAFRLLDDTIVIELLVQDGAAVQPGQILAHVSGPARSLLSAERVALNFLGRLSGIATVTARCVSAIEGTRARILDTRKTTPGLRGLEREAVRAGGGHNHRFSLSDGVLIKDNHIKAAGGITAAITAARRLAPHLLKSVAETVPMWQGAVGPIAERVAKMIGRSSVGPRSRIAPVAMRTRLPSPPINSSASALDCLRMP